MIKQADFPDFYGPRDEHGIAHRPDCPHQYAARGAQQPMPETLKRASNLPAWLRIWRMFTGGLVNACEVCGARSLWREAGEEDLPGGVFAVERWERLPDPEEERRQLTWRREEKQHAEAARYLAEPNAEETRRADEAGSGARCRGRPKGTRSVPRDRIVETFQRLRKSYGRAPTQEELAANLVPRIEVRTLQDHLTDYGLPWPLE